MPSFTELDQDKMKANPFYYAIKKEDLVNAFKDALNISMVPIITQINQLITLYASTSPPVLWVWDFTSRWDYDVWQ